MVLAHTCEPAGDVAVSRRGLHRCCNREDVDLREAPTAAASFATTVAASLQQVLRSSRRRAAAPRFSPTGAVRQGKGGRARCGGSVSLHSITSRGDSRGEGFEEEMDDLRGGRSNGWRGTNQTMREATDRMVLSAGRRLASPFFLSQNSCHIFLGQNL